MADASDKRDAKSRDRIVKSEIQSKSKARPVEEPMPPGARMMFDYMLCTPVWTKGPSWKFGQD